MITINIVGTVKIDCDDFPCTEKIEFHYSELQTNLNAINSIFTFHEKLKVFCKEHSIVNAHEFGIIDKDLMNTIKKMTTKEFWNTLYDSFVKKSKIV